MRTSRPDCAPLFCREKRLPPRSGLLWQRWASVVPAHSAAVNWHCPSEAEVTAARSLLQEFCSEPIAFLSSLTGSAGDTDAAPLAAAPTARVVASLEVLRSGIRGACTIHADSPGACAGE